jgi:hypothetical protein
VVDEQLAAAVEELSQRTRAGFGVEPVVLLDPDPGQLAPPARELIPEPRMLLLGLEELRTGCKPLLAGSDLVLAARHAATGIASRTAPF